MTIPATAAIVLTGVWVTGALLMNGFLLAMALTTAWMAVAGCAALVVAVRSRRSAGRCSYVVTPAVAGAYLGSSVVFDDVVHEHVATACTPRAHAAAPPGGTHNVRLGRGRFESVRHPAAGIATAIRLARGGRVLTLTGFEVDNGPDLRLYLVAGDARGEDEVRDFVDQGELKGNRGDQQYRLPADLDLRRFSTAVVWCRAFSVLFARAPLGLPDAAVT